MNADLDPLAAGAPAPALELARAEPPPAPEAGLLLLCFLPLAGAPICVADVRALAPFATEAAAAGAPLVAASVDPTDALRQFLDEQGAPAIHALGDPQLALARAFRVAWPQRFAARASFLLRRAAGGDFVVAAGAVHPIGFPRPVAQLREWLARG